MKCIEKDWKQKQSGGYCRNPGGGRLPIGMERKTWLQNWLQNWNLYELMIY